MRNLPDFTGGTLAFLLLAVLVAFAVIRIEVEVPEIVVWETSPEATDE